MTDIETIQAELRKFNQERDWDQFHNGKDLAVAISIEAGELLEAFLWKSPEDAKVEKVREELADVLNYAFQMADRYHLDIKEIMLEKLRINAQKYPAEKAKGRADKYNELWPVIILVWNKESPFLYEQSYLQRNTSLFL